MVALLLLPLLLIAMGGAARPAVTAPSAADIGARVHVIVRTVPALLDQVAHSVIGLGGRLGFRLGIIDSFSADLPLTSLDELDATPGVISINDNPTIHSNHVVDGYNPVGEPGSQYNVNRQIKAPDAWARGYTGNGVDVAVIDTGVVPVNGLTAPGAVVLGPDLSFEAPDPSVRYLDTYGHGTAMSGIVGGRDDSVAASHNYTSHDHYVGVAPESRIVSVKVANANGVADVSQVIAAIDWVVANRATGGMNIRVINLSFGTDGIQWYRLDPLADSVEIAWRKGVVVVVSAGNTGYGDEQLNNPAYDPYVIAVGADDTKGTMSTADDQVPTWSTRGNATRHPDLVAPGKSVVGLRSPGSHLDETFPAARIGSRFLRGSGTSQAAAVVSGSVALLLDQRPLLTPDQVKKILMDSATHLPAADAMAQGEGLLNLKAAINQPTPLLYVQTHPISDGSGSLEASRGGNHVSDHGVVLEGEQDIFGQPVDTDHLDAMQLAGNAFDDGTFNGQTWSGQTWSGQTWSGQTWSGDAWDAQTWSAQTWSAQTWSGQTWSGQTWSGQTWSGQTWSGQTWSGQTWSSEGWGD
jgi:serine protease AprX